MAESDWKIALEGMSAANAQAPKGLWTGTFDLDNIAFEISSEGILAA